MRGLKVDHLRQGVNSTLSRVLSGGGGDANAFSNNNVRRKIRLFPLRLERCACIFRYAQRTLCWPTVHDAMAIPDDASSSSLGGESRIIS